MIYVHTYMFGFRVNPTCDLFFFYNMAFEGWVPSF